MHLAQGNQIPTKTQPPKYHQTQISPSGVRGIVYGL